MGAFSLGMIADLHGQPGLPTALGSTSKSLLGEAGLVGQVLYLEAEAASIRSTGIGCYFR